MTPTDLYDVLFTLTSNQRRLRVQGVPRAAAGAASPTAAHRFLRTWHELPLPVVWVPSIGSWGGVHSFEEVVARCGATPSATKSVMHRFHLLAASAKSGAPRRTPQHVVALRSYLKWRGRPAGAGVPQAAGMAYELRILPVEFKIYIECVRELVEEANEYHLPEGVTAAEAYELLLPLLEQQWWAYGELLQDGVARYSGKP